MLNEKPATMARSPRHARSNSQEPITGTTYEANLRGQSPLGDPLNHSQLLEKLWADADAIWDQRGTESSFSGYVSADYPAIYRTLKSLRPNTHTFLEWGSGLGVVTIMASLLGYDAYGIEVEADLVDVAMDLAQHNAVSPKFAVGSFIPDEFCGNTIEGDVFQNTQEDAAAGYEQLDMELRDFDLVYAYPWPEEHQIFRKIIRNFASPNTYFLQYDAREGLALSRPAQHRRRDSTP